MFDISSALLFRVTSSPSLEDHIGGKFIDDLPPQFTVCFATYVFGMKSNFQFTVKTDNSPGVEYEISYESMWYGNVLSTLGNENGIYFEGVLKEAEGKLPAWKWFCFWFDLVEKVNKFASDGGG